MIKKLTFIACNVMLIYITILYYFERLTDIVILCISIMIEIAIKDIVTHTIIMNRYAEFKYDKSIQEVQYDSNLEINTASNLLLRTSLILSGFAIIVLMLGFTFAKVQTCGIAIGIWMVQIFWVAIGNSTLIEDFKLLNLLDNKELQ